MTPSEMRHRPTCGDHGGIAKATGGPCFAWAKLDADGRCRWHPVDGVPKVRAGSTAAAVAQRVELEERCLELRRTGASLRQIGKMLGIHHTHVLTNLKRALEHHRELIAESAHEVLTLELQRLDEMQLRVWPDVLNGQGDSKHKAVSSVLRIMDRRAALLGLDKLQVEHTGNVDVKVDALVSVTGVDVQRMSEEDLAVLELLLRKYGQAEQAEHQVIDITPEVG